MVADLRSGAIDAAWGIPTAQFAGLKSLQGIAAIPYIYMNWDYLNFNCYDEPSSMGNPVLRDWRFRYALNYAVDREQLCRSALQGYALPGTTILPPDTWSDPDYHWQPPADRLYKYDLAEAGRLLDQAGYVRGPGGFRLYKGKPISLRLWAMTDSPQAQAEGRLITGWFERLGLKITFSVLDRGAHEARVWNFKGNTYAPDFDMYVDDWAGYGDPGQTLACETTPQIGYANEPCWSNAEYDRLCDEQAVTLDPQKRKDIIWRMQEIMYEQTPWIVLTYPDYLEAYNTARWTGWTRVLSGHGPAFYTSGNIDSYLNLQPRSAATTAATNVAAVVAAIVAAAVVGVIVVVMLLRRRRHKAEEV
jgi:peptide/nickel transport system substrate-binding protein